MQTIVLARLHRDGPSHGWELGREVADLGIAEHRSVYKVLPRLAEHGLIAPTGDRSEEPSKGSAVSRVVYDLTDAGRARRGTWMRSEPSVPDVRNDLLYRLRYASPDDLPMLLDLADRQLKHLMDTALATRAADTHRGQRVVAPRQRVVSIETAAELLADDHQEQILHATIVWLRRFTETVEKLIPYGARPA